MLQRISTRCYMGIHRVGASVRVRRKERLIKSDRWKGKDHGRNKYSRERKLGRREFAWGGGCELPSKQGKLWKDQKQRVSESLPTEGSTAFKHGTACVVSGSHRRSLCRARLLIASLLSQFCLGQSFHLVLISSCFSLSSN